MSTYNTTNIKNLPQLEEVVNGNYLIIENEIGTNILDFKDFIVGPDNVSFYSNVQNLCTYAVSVSATANSQFVELSTYTTTASANAYSYVNTASANAYSYVNTASANVKTSLTDRFTTSILAITANYKQTFEGYVDNNGEITITGTVGTGTLVAPIILKASDFNIVPINATAANAEWYVTITSTDNLSSNPSMPYSHEVKITTAASATNAKYAVKARKLI